MEQQRQTPNFRLIEIIEDGSAKTFYYSNPEENNNSSFFSRLKAKIQQILRLLNFKNREKKTKPINKL